MPKIPPLGEPIPVAELTSSGDKTPSDSTNSGNSLAAIEAPGAGTGPNQNIDDQDRLCGEDTLSELSQKTWLSREEILIRLQRDLPKAVSDMTSNGTIPTAEQFGGFSSLDSRQTSGARADRGI